MEVEVEDGGKVNYMLIVHRRSVWGGGGGEEVGQ
jgi:hypothetical protein